MGALMVRMYKLVELRISQGCEEWDFRGFRRKHVLKFQNNIEPLHLVRKSVCVWILAAKINATFNIYSHPWNEKKLPAMLS